MQPQIIENIFSVVHTVRSTTILGKRISDARIKVGLLQKQVAYHCAVKQGVVSRWETGECVPMLQHFVALCRVLKTTPNNLLEFED